MPCRSHTQPFPKWFLCQIRKIRHTRWGTRKKKEDRMANNMIKNLEGNRVHVKSFRKWITAIFKNTCRIRNKVDCRFPLWCQAFFSLFFQKGKSIAGIPDFVSLMDRVTSTSAAQMNSLVAIADSGSSNGNDDLMPDTLRSCSTDLLAGSKENDKENDEMPRLQVIHFFHNSRTMNCFFLSLCVLDKL